MNIINILILINTISTIRIRIKNINKHNNTSINKHKELYNLYKPTSSINESLYHKLIKPKISKSKSSIRNKSWQRVGNYLFYCKSVDVVFNKMLKIVQLIKDWEKCDHNLVYNDSINDSTNVCDGECMECDENRFVDEQRFIDENKCYDNKCNASCRSKSVDINKSIEEPKCCEPKCCENNSLDIKSTDDNCYQKFIKLLLNKIECEKEKNDENLNNSSENNNSENSNVDTNENSNINSSQHSNVDTNEKSESIKSENNTNKNSSEDDSNENLMIDSTNEDNSSEKSEITVISDKSENTIKSNTSINDFNENSSEKSENTIMSDNTITSNNTSTSNNENLKFLNSTNIKSLFFNELMTRYDFTDINNFISKLDLIIENNIIDDIIYNYKQTRLGLFNRLIISRHPSASLLYEMCKREFKNGYEVIQLRDNWSESLIKVGYVVDIAVEYLVCLVAEIIRDEEMFFN